MPKAKLKTKGASEASCLAAVSATAVPAAAVPAPAVPVAAVPAAAVPDSAAVPAPEVPELGPSGESGRESREIISDEEAFLYIKRTSRESYKNAWEAFRSSNPDVQQQFEERIPSERELLDYFVGMREGRMMEDGEKEEGKAATTILTTYSLINGVLKHKYSFNMNKYPRISARIKVWQSEDVKKKAAIFTPEELKQFCESEELQGGYWEVRKAIVALAYFGGLRLVEAMSLELEKISPTDKGFDVVHERAKGRSDKPNSKYSVPTKKVPKEGEAQTVEDSFDWAGCLGQYLRRVKNELGKFQGRVFYTGRKNGGLVSQPMGRNKLAEVPHEVARFLGKERPEDYTFHSFRRSSATAAADAGATAQQMQDFFGWKNQAMTAEYISTSRHQITSMADRLATVREEPREERKEAWEPREERKEAWKPSERKRKKRKEEESSSSSSEEEERKKATKRRRGEKKVIIINM